MINIDEVYPNLKQYAEVKRNDICISQFEQQRGNFYDNCERSRLSKFPISDSILLKEEISRIEKFKEKANNPPFEYEGIDLYQFFEGGWNNYIIGYEDKTVPNDAWKDILNITRQIEEKFREVNPPLNFFEELSERSIYIYYIGMGTAKYYTWLLDRPSKETLNPKKPTKTGFKRTLSDTQVQSLFDQLKGTYIDESTNSEHFKAIFIDELLPTEFKKVKWRKTNVLLSYFVSKLFQKGNPTDYWSIAENCFTPKNLKQSFNNAYQFNPDQKPKGFNEIDLILKNIYHPLQ